jgi:hypothetical protein
MPAHNFTPGSDCYLKAAICNPDSQSLSNIPFFCLLDAAGFYWFYPGWSADPDWETLSTLPEGSTIKMVIDPFTWPSGAGSGSGVRFLSAITNPEMTEVSGGIGQWEFGWSP